MGEVYRARDSTLNRDVAIKVLLPSVADDPDRLARFRRDFFAGGKLKKIQATGGPPLALCDAESSRNGRELFFARPGEGKLSVVAVAPTPGGGPFSFGEPQALFALAPYLSQVGRSPDVSPDGQRFVAVKLPGTLNRQDSVVAVSHWFDELRARVPIK